MIEYLDKSALEDALSLQSKVMDTLFAANATHHILPRSRRYLEAHLDGEHQLIGIRNDEGVLVAQAVFHNPDHFDLEAETGTSSLPGYEQGQKVTTIQNVLVHPHMRQRGLMHKLMDEWLKWAQENNYDHAIARMAIDHSSSINRFFKNDFNLTGLVLDARDKISVFVAHKSLSKKDFPFTDKTIMATADDPAMLKRHLDNGYVCTALDTEQNLFVLEKLHE